MKILIADDHAILRKGLIQLFIDAFPEVMVGEASNTTETLESLSQKPWDLLVLDIFMPGRGGLEILSTIRRQHPNLPVLVLSSAPEDQLGLRVLKSGARGYLNKQAAPEELVKAVRQILAGGRYVSAGLADRLAEVFSVPKIPLHSGLSDREYSVMKLLVEGKSINQIAEELSLSVKTISTYHVRIWKKLRVRSDIEMTRYVIDHGLV